MARSDKSAYTNKQKRQAEHIEEVYEHRGVPEEAAERRTWATVNKMAGGGKKSGSGRERSENHQPARRGGHLGGEAASHPTPDERSASAKKAAASRLHQERSASAKKAAETRKRNQESRRT
jgi:plasmid stabilization system protein ParE